MAQPAGYKNLMSIPPIWQNATAEPPMEWTKWTSRMEIAVLAKNGIEVRILLYLRPPIIDPTEPIYKLEIDGATEAEKRKRHIRKQEKTSTGKTTHQELEKEEHLATVYHGTMQMREV